MRGLVCGDGINVGFLEPDLFEDTLSELARGLKQSCAVFFFWFLGRDEVFVHQKKVFIIHRTVE